MCHLLSISTGWWSQLCSCGLAQLESWNSCYFCDLSLFFEPAVLEGKHTTSSTISSKLKFYFFLWSLATLLLVDDFWQHECQFWHTRTHKHHGFVSPIHQDAQLKWFGNAFPKGCILPCPMKHKVSGRAGDKARYWLPASSGSLCHTTLNGAIS